MAQQAMDTFVAVMDDGSERLVTRGEMLPDSHELVKRDAKGGGQLFRPVNIDGDDVPPAKSTPAKAGPPAAAPVKAPAAAKASPAKAAPPGKGS
jgi:hypothetical protein